MMNRYSKVSLFCIFIAIFYISIPLILLAINENYLLKNCYLIIIFVAFGPLTMAILAEIGHYKAGKMSFKCWCSSHLYARMAFSISILLLSYPILLFFLHTLVSIKTGRSFHTSLIILAMLMVGLPIFFKVRKDSIRKTMGFEYKHFRAMPNEIVPIINKVLCDLNLRFDYIVERSKFLQFEKFKFNIENTDLRIKAFRAGLNDFVVAIGEVTPSNKDLVRKIQCEIDIFHDI